MLTTTLSVASPGSPTPDLPTYLCARREALLSSWRTTCENDAQLHTVSALSREEFNDCVPTILDQLNHLLGGEAPTEDVLRIAAEHGLHRWHKGYALKELLREVALLQRNLLDELRTYASLYPAVEPDVLTNAYRLVMELISDVAEGSVAQYDELQRTAAASRASALQSALDQVTALSRERIDLLRSSTHDLRSSVGIIQGAAFMLDLNTQSPEERSQLTDMLNRNLTNVQMMLQNLMSLARLDAGQDPAQVARFDAAELLRELAQSARPLAIERGLVLLTSGPDQLLVNGDMVKVRRIVQNLLLNALLYTQSGMVSLSWSKEDEFRWAVGVQDTGAGLPSDITAALLNQLKPTQESASVFQSQPVEPPSGTEPPVVTRSELRGEGIGLHIVKRLCEVLEATIDIETQPGQGTLIRVRFPIQHK